MKKIKVLLTAVLLIVVCSSLQQVSAQENSNADQKTDAKIQQAIELEKKAMVDQKKSKSDQKKAQEDAANVIGEEQEEAEETPEDVQVEVDAIGESMDRVRVFNKRHARSFQFDEPFVFTSPQIEAFYNNDNSDDSESTTWNFSKSVNENTFSREYTFDVEKTANSVVMSVNGDCKAGEIRIKIIMPNGKNYSDIVIDEFGNLNWRKSFSISESENQDKAGEWKFKIESTKATGYFKISLQTN